MSLEEKAALLSGTNFMETNPIPRLGIPGLVMADGPHGLRKQIGSPETGDSHSEPATAFPTAAALASSWNIDNARKIGVAIADECRHYGVNILLGPGVNIKRNPRCGRNFEYYSEDPLLAGALGAAFVHGVQSRAVGVSVKHFAANNQENFRFVGESVVDERALREIYLRPFEIIVKQAKPYTLMCAYNKIRGEFCSENRWLLTDVLRDEWGFDGVVMTDWGAAKDRAQGVVSGLDLEMPGDTAYGRRRIVDGVKDGSLSEEALNTAVRNMLRLIDKCHSPRPVTLRSTQPGAPVVDWDQHHALAAEIAANSAVLLENDGSLPLGPSARLLVVGDMFSNMRYQGSGSSLINPTRLTTPKDAFDLRAIQYTFVQDYAKGAHLAQGVAAAQDVDAIVFFGGLTDFVETEAGDRDDMRLPPDQVATVDALIETGKPVVVVLFGGSPVEIPFADRVNAILNMCLPGQNGGEATAALLFGEINPSGKLAESWPERYADVPFGDEYSTNQIELYRESIFVGYRYYATAGVRPRWPFGHGLSYTHFTYSNMIVRTQAGSVVVTCDITNDGVRDGAEAVQLYVQGPPSGVPKPVRELRAFDKVSVRAGATEQAVLRFNAANLAYYDTVAGRRVQENGVCFLEIGASSEDIRLRREFVPGGSVEQGYGSARVLGPGDDVRFGSGGDVGPGGDVRFGSGGDVPIGLDSGVIEAYSNLADFRVPDSVLQKLLDRPLPQAPPALPLTMESTLEEFRRTLFGRLVYKVVLSRAERQRKRALKLPHGPERDNGLKGADFLTKILATSSPRTLSMSAAHSLPWHWAQALVDLGNGRLLGAVKHLISPIKVPPLPKQQNRHA